MQQAGFAEQLIEAAVFDHVGQAFTGVLGVQWHVGRAGFQHGEQADDQLRTTVQCQADTGTRAGTVGEQALGQVVGLGIQLAVAQGLTVNLQRQRVGIGRSLGSNLLVGEQCCG